MSLPQLFPIYPDPIPLIYKPSLSLPSPGFSKISSGIGITASYPFLMPNIDYIRKFIEGNIGITDKIMQQSLFLNFNNPITQKNENVFKKFSQINNINFPDSINKWKEENRIRLPKESIILPPMDGIGLKALEKTILTSITDTQKPFIEVCKLITESIIKIEDTISRTMPLLGIPGKTKSLKPEYNPNALGYNSLELKKSLSTIESISGNQYREPISDDDGPISIQDITGNLKWKIISTIYSTGTYIPGVDYKWTYIKKPVTKIIENQTSDNNDSDVYDKYKPDKIILGIFKSDGSPLNPNEYLETIGVDNQGNINLVKTTIKKADWILKSNGWILPDEIWSWPSLNTPIFRWQKNNTTKDSSKNPGQDWSIKKYKKGDKNLITGGVAIEGNPIITGFEKDQSDEYLDYFKDLINQKINKSKVEIDINKIIGQFEVKPHLENIHLYNQLNLLSYKEINGLPAFPQTMKIAFKPLKINLPNVEADNDISGYNISKGYQPGSIWIDPESDYNLRVIRIDPTTMIDYIEPGKESNIKLEIKSFIKNKSIFKLYNNGYFDIIISKNKTIVENYTNIREYTLDNWNYTRKDTSKPIIENLNVYNIQISSKTPTSYYLNRPFEIFHNGSNWVEIIKNGNNWFYKEFEFKNKTVSGIDISTLLNYDTINKLYQIYLSNKSSAYTFSGGTILLSDLFNATKSYKTVVNGNKLANDGTSIYVNNEIITKWIYHEGEYNNQNLPPFGVEKTFTINEKSVSISEKNIPLSQIKAVNNDFPWGKIIDQSKINNDYLLKSNRNSNNDDQIEIIKRHMLTDMDTESYFVVEGTSTKSGNVEVNDPDHKYYKISDALGSSKNFILLITDIFTKILPKLNQIIELSKDPSNLVVNSIKNKLGESFNIFSKESIETFNIGKSEREKYTNSIDKIKSLKTLFESSPLLNTVFVNKNGDYKFLLDGIAMMPFTIFGNKIPFGMELNFDDIEMPIKPIFDIDLPRSKVKNIQDFLKPPIKKFNIPSKPLTASQLKSARSNIIKEGDDINDMQITDIKYSTGYFSSDINYNYIYLNQDENKILSQSSNILNSPNEIIDISDIQKNLEDLSNLLKIDPNNYIIKDTIKELKNKIRGLNSNTQPLLKSVMGFICLPISIIDGIVQWLIDFFKNLKDPNKLPDQITELLSFEWLMNFFLPKNLLNLAGIKLNPEKLLEWLNLIKDKSIPDDYELIDVNQILSAPFLPTLPIYTVKQFRNNPLLPIKIFFPILCLIEKFINAIINFIWSLMGIEALIPAPNIKLCSNSKDPNINDAVNLVKELNKNKISDISLQNEIPSGILYDITLNDGTVIEKLNYEELQKYIAENQDINFNFQL